ncbi:hypothetical protein B1992_07700 [Pseudoxanthomonas broegbernensis]|uniref:Uncharacterized protein n=1 Tax=Pseudoxanthomonas broegbernensis TaxID=83619 RepID=A0A7V8GMB9_9GAMM|nr:hypothetical protein [Pseudoxanthomonas broegbernensis]KAF1686429.1 hypothetical protein B1992_07700 [Pseudoxanthomonas broegbernensis]MBB6064320.1 hypothetical protein [Pseudoxanthomonas broegbernensis]
MTSVKSASPKPPRATHWLWPPLLLIGAATMVAAWASLALASGRQHGWIALAAALQAAWLLRLGGMPRGWPRRLLAAATTLAVTATAQWLVASGHIGGQMGLPPWLAAPKMGAYYVWTLSLLANTRLDLLCLGLAPLLALRAAR